MRFVELYRLCRKAKEIGIGIMFIDFGSDNDVSISIYLDGYKKGFQYDKHFELEETKTSKIDEAIAYLTNVIKEKAPQGLASE